MKRLIVIASVLFVLVGLAMAAEYVSNIATGTKIMETINSDRDTTVLDQYPLVRVTDGKVLYKGLMYTVRCPNRVAWGDAVDSLGKTDTAIVELWGVHDWMNQLLESDTCVPPCSVINVIPDTGNGNPILWYDAFYLRIISEDSVGDGAGDSSKQTFTYSIRGIKESQ